MSSSINSSTPPQNGFWASITPYVVPPVAASIAIVPVFRDMVAKSAMQKGQPIPCVPFSASLKAGIKAAPTVGAIVGTQMIIQSLLEKTLAEDSKATNLSSTLASSAIVGAISAPVLAVFNGQTMGWSMRESLRKFSPRQGLAIATQETAFVGGLSVSDKLAIVMRRNFGDYKAIDYTAAFIAGSVGSLAGHPANTALTRWQSGMPLNSFSQSMWGATRKARAIGCFSIVYKLGKDLLNPTQPPKQ